LPSLPEQPAHCNGCWATCLDGREDGAWVELRYIGIRHEGAAAFAASGYAKLTGRPAARTGPEASHPVYPVKLDPIGFGFLVPVFFVTSGIRLNLRDVLGDPSALALVPLVLALLVLVRAVPAVA